VLLVLLLMLLLLLLHLMLMLLLGRWSLDGRAVHGLDARAQPCSLAL
jgi:hypothetical protein